MRRVKLLRTGMKILMIGISRPRILFNDVVRRAGMTTTMKMTTRTVNLACSLRRTILLLLSLDKRLWLDYQPQPSLSSSLSNFISFLSHNHNPHLFIYNSSLSYECFCVDPTFSHSQGKGETPSEEKESAKASRCLQAG
jgi:hypothetical protein